MMSLRLWKLMGLAVMVTPLAAHAMEESTFTRISVHYEAIRLALLSDTTEGVAERARAIRDEAVYLAGDFTPKRAGVAEESGEECRKLLPELSAAAARLAAASSLEETREALFEVSKPLGRYRKLAGTDGSIVVYCSMARKAWIQPEGTIGNPYMGRSMPRCGEIVPE